MANKEHLEILKQEVEVWNKWRQDHPNVMTVSENGFIKWYKKSKDFNYHIKVGDKLNPYSCAFYYFDGEELSDEPENVPAYAWIAGNIEEDAEIVEYSFPLPRYNIVLSLLWINEDIQPFYRRDDVEDQDMEYDLTNPFTPDGKRWLW